MALEVLPMIIVIRLISMVQSNMMLHLLPSGTEGGQCTDGSMSGFYYEGPQYGTSRLLVINIRGGGYCNTKEMCQLRSFTELGSSKYWSSTMVGSKVLSTDCNINPYFCNGHHVFIPYCSGDIWSGTRISNTDEATWGFYFSGHLIFENIINGILQHINLQIINHVLLYGGSAGGIGVYINIDWLRNKLIEYNPNIIVKGVSIAGWYFPNSGSNDDELIYLPPNNYPNYINDSNGGWGHDNVTYNLWQSYYAPNCAQWFIQNVCPETNDCIWHCMSIDNLYRFIESPIFTALNQFEKNQIHSAMQMPDEYNQDTIDYVNYYGMRMYNSTVIQIKIPNGLFLASCFDHGQGIVYGTYIDSYTTINGMNSSIIIGDWYWDHNQYPHIVVDDLCQLPCNPTCNGFGPK